MKGFWKWFFIVLGILVLIGIAFCVTLFFLRGGAGMGLRAGVLGNHMRFPGARVGVFGGMMGGLGLMMLFRGLIPLGILVLAGFGVAYFVRNGRKNNVSVMPVASAVCSNCGKPLAADWKTCPHCGTPVDKTEPPASV
jgi:hypothetical protein